MAVAKEEKKKIHPPASSREKKHDGKNDASSHPVLSPDQGVSVGGGRAKKGAIGSAAKKVSKEKKKEIEATVRETVSVIPLEPKEEVAVGGAGAPAALSDIEEEHARKPERYFEAVGRRKTAVARVRVFTRAGDFTVNNKLYGQYFPTLELQKITEDSLQKMKLFGRFRVSVKVTGGGVHSQAEAVRHGLARALTKFNPDFRKRLKRAGFLTRDPRMKERKKFGLKKARRAPQWQKR